MAEKTNMRTRVAELIDTGEYTKVELAEALETKPAGISSNMTYLRWGGKFIIWDENKKLSFTDEAGFDEWNEARKANTKSAKAVSKLSPQEQYDKYTKTIASQTKSLSNWEAKVDKYEEDAPKDETLLPEAQANVVLLGIKIGRNTAKLNAVDASEVTEVAAVEESEELL